MGREERIWEYLWTDHALLTVVDGGVSDDGRDWCCEAEIGDWWLGVTDIGEV
jgi:hypothetical protein